MENIKILFQLDAVNNNKQPLFYINTFRHKINLCYRIMLLKIILNS